jgi:uncharacterized membrane protein
MAFDDLLELFALFGAGLLAGEELVIRYGVRGPLATLDDQPHIRLRQALIRTLRVLVPAMFLPTLLLTVAVTLSGSGTGATASMTTVLTLRLAAVLALLAWLAITLGGTAPINAAALEWQPTAPPPDWRQRVDRWERLNTIRAWLAIAAFALLLLAALS